MLKRNNCKVISDQRRTSSGIRSASLSFCFLPVFSPHVWFIHNLFLLFRFIPLFLFLLLLQPPPLKYFGYCVFSSPSPPPSPPPPTFFSLKFSLALLLSHSLPLCKLYEDRSTRRAPPPPPSSSNLVNPRVLLHKVPIIPFTLLIYYYYFFLLFSQVIVHHLPLSSVCSYFADLSLLINLVPSTTTSFDKSSSIETKLQPPFLPSSFFSFALNQQ